MHVFKKKQWARPEIEQLKIAQARKKVLAALDLIDGDGKLVAECDELRLIADELKSFGRGKCE